MVLTPAETYFAGHFPGQPILPGVTQIALAAAAIRREFDGAPLRVVRHARLRQLVGPGERLELLTRSIDGNRARFELRRDAKVVTNGELEFGALTAADESEPPMLGEPFVHPPVEQLLPHRPPMLFVQRVLAVDEHFIACEAGFPIDCPLAAPGGVAPAIAAVEAAAQAAATWEALRRQSGGAEAGGRIGYLVSLRELTFMREGVSLASPFVVIVRLQSRVLPLSTYAIEVLHEHRQVLRGEIGTFLAAAG